MSWSARVLQQPAELEHAAISRSGQLWLFGTRTSALELAISRGHHVRYAPNEPTGVRSLTGAAEGRRVTLTDPVAALPLRVAKPRAGQARGPRHAVLGRLGGRCGQGRRDRRGDGRGAGGALAGGRPAPLRARLVGAGGGGRRRASLLVFTYLGPRSCSTRSSTSSRRLPAGRTRADVIELAREAGIDVGDVYVVDASRRTNAANAYVTGIGHTKRVVLYDTLVDRFPPAQTRLVVAHELGHVKHDDLWADAMGRDGGAGGDVRRRERDRDADGRKATTVAAVAHALALIAPVSSSRISNQLSRAIEAARTPSRSA